MLVGEDGRPRVLDFGLVRTDKDGGTSVTLDDDELERTGSHGTLLESLRESDQHLEEKLTRAGAIMGTPAYMSPEQIRGRAHEVDARSDQFSFCVVLYEALYGQLPFAGETMRALFDAVTRGELRPPPRGTRVPSWVARALQRGDVAAAAGLASELETVLAGDARFVIEPLPLPRMRNGWAVGMAVKKSSMDLAQALQGALNDLANNGALKTMFAKDNVAWRPA